MTKFLLSCFAITTAASAMASPQAVSHVRVSDKGIPEKSVSIAKANKTTQSRIAAGNVGITISDAQRSIKNLSILSKTRLVSPFIKKAPAHTSASGPILFEDFEGWDGSDINWLPDGFELRHESGRDDAEGWSMASPESFAGMMGGMTGNCMSITYDEEFLDEWLVFPEVTLGENMILSFDAYNDGVWYFSMENVDWNTYEYVGDKIIVLDQQVMISEDGGENWSLVKSLAEDFLDYNLEELIYEGTNGLRPVNVSLAEYSGKTVKIAFRYVGTDGNTSAIDNITIGNPMLEVSYTNPLGTLFFGMSKDSSTLNASILTGPVFRTMTFDNTTYDDDATYSWDYFGPESTWLTADTQDDLDVEYHTDYTDASTTVNNLYYTPILNGSAPGYSEGSFSRGRYLQAGGKGQYLTKDADSNPMIIDFGLSVIDPSSEGNCTVSDATVPVFGYNSETDRFWTEYTFGDEGDEDNYAKLNAYMDYFFTSDYPIVISGVHAPAFAQIKDGVKFKAEIVPLSDEGVIMDPIAVAECGYSDLTVIPTGGVNDYISMNFKFDEPVVMSSDVCFAYVVRISGFNDPEHVEYFNPIMSAESNPDEYALGWIEKTIVMDGNARTSTTPAVNYIDDMLSFYIMLDAEYPWLEGPSKVEAWNGSVGTVVLDSSVPGEELSFDGLPSWLTAEAAGQYGNTVVTFHVAMTDDIKGTADITVSAPGVSHVITVDGDTTSSVANISETSSTVEIYDISGIRVSSMTSKGIYLVKDASGRVRKISVD